MRAYTFGARGSNLRNLFHVTCCEAGLIIWVQLLRGFYELLIANDRPRLCNITKVCVNCASKYQYNNDVTVHVALTYFIM